MGYFDTFDSYGGGQTNLAQLLMQLLGQRGNQPGQNSNQPGQNSMATSAGQFGNSYSGLPPNPPATGGSPTYPPPGSNAPQANSLTAAGASLFGNPSGGAPQPNPPATGGTQQADYAGQLQSLLGNAASSSPLFALVSSIVRR